MSKIGREKRIVNGILYDSLAEADFARTFTDLDKTILRGWARQVPIVIAGNTYRIDFLLDMACNAGPIPEGVSLIDVKGVVKQRDRDLLRAYKVAGPSWPLLFVYAKRRRGHAVWEIAAKIDRR